MSVPFSVRRWLQSAYGARFSISDEWLEPAWAYCVSQHPTATTQVHIKALNEQFLLASLESTIDAAVIPDEISLESDLDPPLDIRIGVDAPLLVEIQSMTEIGHSAGALRDVHEERKEEKRIERAGGVAANARIARMDDAEDGQQQQAQNTLPTDGEEERKKAPKFPRAMLSFVLSDGERRARAIEYRRLPELSLEDTELGCKMLLRNVRVLRGIMMLEPGCVTIKGGRAPEQVEAADEIFEAGLRDRFGLPEPAPIQRQPTPPRQPAPPRPTRPVAPPADVKGKRKSEPDDFDDLIDDSVFEEMDIDQIEEIERTATAQTTATTSSGSSDLPILTDDRNKVLRERAMARLAASRAKKAVKVTNAIELSSD